MSLRHGKAFKGLLVLLAGLLCLGVSRVQQSLNRQREQLGLTRVEPLENAPPVLAFTTVALGGFRGLIANALWIRASDLQEEGKYFEMVQLADWITKLEPHFVQVWLVQSWNMAYNISVKFKDAPDRWRWVQSGIGLLRDDGLRYNPNEPLIYRELAWFFQHKMGQNLDDAHMYYKQMWANEMSGIFGMGRPDFGELIDPQTEEQQTRARLLREKYKMDPQFLQKVDERYGPLEWRLPESHAIYWAALGLEELAKDPRVNQDELRMLRRAIFQSMQLAFLRGRLVANPYERAFDFGPNLDIVPKVNEAYEKMIGEDEGGRENFKNAHRNFLIRAVFFLYTYNRQAEAGRWFAYLREHYPNKQMVEGDPDSQPGRMTLDEFVVRRVSSEVGDTSRDNIRAVLEGLVANSFYNLAIDEDDQAVGYDRLAQQVWARFKAKTAGIEDRLPMATMGEIKQEVLKRMLDPEQGLPPEMANQIRTKLGLPAPTNAPTAVPKP